MEGQGRLQELRKEQERITRKMSLLVLQTIVIFGVPAILGYFAGVYLESVGVAKVLAYIVPLLGTFVFSWFILIKKLNGFKKEVEKVELEIRRLAPPVIPENRDESEERGNLK